jgi:hypothetical protein
VRDLEADSATGCFDVRLFSARCLGIYESGAAKRGPVPGAARACVHSGQNLAVAETWLPQFGHARASGGCRTSLWADSRAGTGDTSSALPHTLVDDDQAVGRT